MDIDTKIDGLEYTDRVASGQVVVECDIPMEDRGGLDKILSVTCNVTNLRNDCFEKEVKVYGKVDYKILYLNADNIIDSIAYCSDFDETIACDDITTSSKVISIMRVNDVDSMAKGNSIRLQSVIDVNILSNVEKTIERVTDVSDAFCKMSDMETSVHICHIDDKFTIEEEYTAGCNIEKILLFHSRVYMASAKPTKDAISISGEASVNILYLSDGKYVTKNLIIPYSKEVKCLGIDKTSVVSAMVDVASSKILLSGVEDNNSMKISLDIKVEGKAYDYGVSEYVEDVYSCQNELDIERKSVAFNKMIDYKTINERVSGETSIGEDEKSIKKIIATIPTRRSLNNVKVEDGAITIDSIEEVNVVYLDQDEKYVVLDVEIPSSISVPSEMVRVNDKVYADIVVENVAARVKRERDIDIVMEVVISLATYRELKYDVIKSIEEGKEKMNDHKAISIYFVKEGDSMWDIVRNIGSNEESIRLANKEIDFDNLQGGERVLVFRGQN